MHFDINSGGSGDVYIVFENGMMVYLELKKGLQLEKSNVYRLTGFPTENLRISVGYFTKAE